MKRFSRIVICNSRAFFIIEGSYVKFFVVAPYSCKPLFVPFMKPYALIN